MDGPALRTFGGLGVRVSVISLLLIVAILGLWLVVALSVGATDAGMIHHGPGPIPVPGIAR